MKKTIKEPKMAKKVEPVEVEAVSAETEAAPKKRLTDEEKAQRRLENERRKEEEEMRELVAQIRRPIQAKALWAMYQKGELQRQTIRYKSEYGEIRQEMLYSHRSIYAE
jgi:pyruvate kinase